MFSVSSFFDLPALTRFRWMNGVGAFSLACAMLARWTTDLMPGADFYPLEVVGVVTLSLFAAFGHHSNWIRQHTHAAMYCVLVPPMCHFLYGHYETGIASGMLMSFGTWFGASHWIEGIRRGVASTKPRSLSTAVRR